MGIFDIFLNEDDRASKKIYDDRLEFLRSEMKKSGLDSKETNSAFLIAKKDIERKDYEQAEKRLTNLEKVIIRNRTSLTEIETRGKLAILRREDLNRINEETVRDRIKRDIAQIKEDELSINEVKTASDDIENEIMELEETAKKTRTYDDENVRKSIREARKHLNIYKNDPSRQDRRTDSVNFIKQGYFSINSARIKNGVQNIKAPIVRGTEKIVENAENWDNERYMKKAESNKKTLFRKLDDTSYLDRDENFTNEINYAKSLVDSYDERAADYIKKIEQRIREYNRQKNDAVKKDLGKEIDSQQVHGHVQNLKQMAMETGLSNDADVVESFRKAENFAEYVKRNPQNKKARENLNKETKFVYDKLKKKNSFLGRLGGIFSRKPDNATFEIETRDEIREPITPYTAKRYGKSTEEISGAYANENEIREAIRASISRASGGNNEKEVDSNQLDIWNRPLIKKIATDKSISDEKIRSIVDDEMRKYRTPSFNQRVSKGVERVRQVGNSADDALNKMKNKIRDSTIDAGNWLYNDSVKNYDTDTSYTSHNPKPTKRVSELEIAHRAGMISDDDWNAIKKRNQRLRGYNLNERRFSDDGEPNYSEEVRIGQKAYADEKTLRQHAGNVTQSIASQYHKIEPEDNRLPRAVAWGKREIDARLRKENINIKNKIDEIRGDIQKEIDKLTKEENEYKSDLEVQKSNLKDCENKILQLHASKTGLMNAEVLEKQSSVIQKNIAYDENKLAETRAKLQNNRNIIYKEVSGILESEKEASEKGGGILTAIVNEVVEKAEEKFSITRPDLRQELRNSLRAFADQEMVHMLNNDMKTIYNGLFTRASSNANRFFEFFERSILGDLIFSPVFTGGIVVYALSWIILLNETGDFVVDATLLLSFMIILVITLLVGMGRR